MVYFLCKAYDSDRQNCYFALSLPVRGAWIEMLNNVLSDKSYQSLPVRGAWIEMYAKHPKETMGILSLPVRGAWIEMNFYDWGLRNDDRRSPCGERGLKYQITENASGMECRSPCGERGLKCFLGDGTALPCRSLPVRGAWIEISSVAMLTSEKKVAPRAGSVD